MAIAVQSTSTASFAAGSTRAITKPTGLAVGDLMIAKIGAFAGVGLTISTLSGWTLVSTRSLTNGSISIQYKIADSGDVAASDFTFSCTSASNMCGAILRVTGHASTAPFDKSEDDVNNTAGSTSISFTAASTPATANNLVVLLFGAGDGAGTATVSAYTTTPSVTLTEVLDTTIDAGSQDPVVGSAYGVYSGTSQFTNYGATLSVSKDDHAGILAFFQVQVDASGTAVLHEASPTFFAPTASAGASGTNALLSVSPTFFTEQSKATSPTQWSNETKPSTTWVNEEL